MPALDPQASVLHSEGMRGFIGGAPGIPHYYISFFLFVMQTGRIIIALPLPIKTCY